MSKVTLFSNLHLPDNYHQQGNCLLVEKDRIVFFGELDKVREVRPHIDHEVDLAGKTILPGLCDFHLHLSYTADKLDAVDCETDSLKECLERVAEKTKNTPVGEWIIGYGWNHNAWQPADYGTVAQLDAICPRHPVLLHAKSLHAAWVNSLALQLIGIDRNTGDPEGGVIMRNDSGNPTGILLENAAFLASDCIPQATIEQTAKKIMNAQSYFHSLGLTAVHDFDRFESAEALIWLADRGHLRLRVTKNLPSEQIDRVISENWREKLFRPPFLYPGWLKVFADGALGPQSAAMLEPYEGSHNVGMLLVTAEELAALGIKAALAGWPLSVHAIGDRAIREVLDGFTLLRQLENENCLPALPHRIEHVQIIHPTDLKRMYELGIIASVQPIHATSDMYTADHFWGKRSEYAYSYQSLFSQGITVRFGSDSPVESCDPFQGIHAAVTRQRKNGQPNPDGWYPNQRVNLQQAIDAYTQPLPGNSKTEFFSVGMPADFIAFDQDPYQVDPSQLAGFSPSMTVFAGEVVYNR